MVDESEFRARTKRMNMEDSWSNDISCACTNIGCILEPIRVSIELFPASC